MLLELDPYEYRYLPIYYDKLMDQRILKRISSDGPLQSLTDAELRRDTLPITRDPKPRPCKAWVRFGPTAVEVDAVVVWNDVACGIEFPVGDTTMRCWVWANAVTPTSGRQDRGDASSR